MNIPTRTFSGVRYTSLFLVIVIALLFYAQHSLFAQSNLTFLSFGTSTQLSTGLYSIPILLSNNANLINSAQIKINVDPSEILVHNITINDTLCEDRFLIEKTIAPSAGSAYYACGTIVPFDGLGAELAQLIFEPLPHTNSTTLTFSAGDTSIHAHDGFGTQVLGTTTSKTLYFLQ